MHEDEFSRWTELENREAKNIKPNVQIEGGTDIPLVFFSIWCYLPVIGAIDHRGEGRSHEILLREGTEERGAFLGPVSVSEVATLRWSGGGFYLWAGCTVSHDNIRTTPAVLSQRRFFGSFRSDGGATDKTNFLLTCFTVSSLMPYTSRGSSIQNIILPSALLFYYAYTLLRLREPGVLKY